MIALAKLTRPKVHEVVQRERLFAKLDDVRDRYPVIWIAGPPGAGKTTLVASYLDATKMAGVWYQVDAGDDDISTFFYFLSRALQTTKTKRKPPLPMLTPEYLADIPGYTRRFFREFFSRLKLPAVVTLDNYHQLPANSALHGVLEQAMMEMPEGLSIIVVSREDPPVWFAQLTSMERLTRIEWDDLRLTFDETRDIVAKRLDADDTTLRLLYDISGGWAAGLTLSLERFKRSGGKAHHVQGEALESIFNYFSGQIFNTSSPETREFLIRTALLPRMTINMAEKLSGNPHAGDLLDYLYRRRLFTNRLGLKPFRYEYHDLFRAFLLDHLEKIYTPAGIDELRQRAAKVCEEVGQVEDAFPLLQMAHDWDGAARLILGSAEALLTQGRGRTLREWIGALPATTIKARPWINYWRGISELQSAPAHARESLELAFEELKGTADVLGQVLACAGIIFTYFVEFKSLTPLDRWIDAMYELLGVVPAFPSPAVELHINTALVFALSFRRPDQRLVQVHVRRAEELLASDDIPVNDKVLVGSVLLGSSASSFRHPDGRRLLDRIKPLLSQTELTPVNRATWYLNLGWHLWWEADASGAQEAFSICLEVCAAGAIALPVLHAYSLAGCAVLAVDRGELAVAESYRLKAERYAGSDRHAEAANDAWTRGSAAAARGDWTSAIKFDEDGVGHHLQVGAHHYILNTTLGLSVHLIEAGRFVEAERQLEVVHAAAKRFPDERLAVDIAMIEGYSALRQGNRDTWESKFQWGITQLRLSEDRLCLRFLSGLPVMATLFATALAADLEAEYVSHLIRRFKVRAPSPEAPNWPWSLKVYTLGRFKVLVDGVPLEFGRKAPKKLLQLLKALIAFGGVDVSEQRLTDALWPDESGDAAHNSCGTSVTRLRRLLIDPEAIEQIGGRVSLNPNRVWIDIQAFERALGQANTNSITDAKRVGQAVDYYRGSFLSDDAEEPWTVSARERLRSKFIAGVSSLAQHHERNNHIALAMDLYRRGIEADELAEAFYRGLMRCHRQRDERAEALSVYRRLRQTLSITLGIVPSAATEALVAELRGA